MNAIIAKCPQCNTKNKVPAARQHQRPNCGRCKSPLPMGQVAVPVELNDSEFAAFVQKAELPVMVDFFSPTCGPCQMLSPTLNNLTKTFFGKIIIAKVDVSKNAITSQRFQVRGVPALLFFKKGSVVDQLVGAVPEPQLAAKIQQVIA